MSRRAAVRADGTPVRRLGLLRAVSGTLAAGLAVLALALVVVTVVAARAGAPGPGAGTLAWHGLGALAAVAGQVYADRTAGARGAVAALVVIALVATVLAVEWLG